MDKLAAVLDTSALLSYLKGESGAKVIENIIDKSIMATINITEAIIVLGRKKPQQLERYQMAISELVSHKYETDLDLMQLIAEISVKYGETYNLSLSDCYCLALGKYLKLPIYTGDKPWIGLNTRLGIEIRFIS